MIIKVYWSSSKVPVILSNFNGILIFSTDFRKILNIEFREDPTSGRRVVPCGRTDGHDEADSRFSQFAPNKRPLLSTALTVWCL